MNDVANVATVGIETNFEKGTGPEPRRKIIVEDKNKQKTASKKRYNSTFVNESFNFNNSSLVTQSFLNPKRDTITIMTPPSSYRMVFPSTSSEAYTAFNHITIMKIVDLTISV